jgi:hypothetical protein
MGKVSDIDLDVGYHHRASKDRACRGINSSLIGCVDYFGGLANGSLAPAVEALAAFGSERAQLWSCSVNSSV